MAAEWGAADDGGLRRGRARRHGDDREAGRLRRAREHDHRRAAGRRPYELTGHKWFCSYPPCDVFLTLAQAPAGLSCFVFESSDPGFRIQRLKDKLGTRSLPSSEVEFHGVRARLVGEEGRGVPTIIRMVNHTRLDCLLDRGLVHALGHGAGHLARPPPQRVRQAARGPARDDQRAGRPGARVRGGDGGGLPHRARVRRGQLGVPALRHRGHEVLGLKRAPQHAIEALECLGGNGYVEESGMPRLYRDSPLNSIWEGSGNVAALDVPRDGEGARRPARLPRRMRAGARLGRASTRTSTAPERNDRGPRRHRPSDGRPPRGGGPRRGAPGEPAGAGRTSPRSPTRSARGASATGPRCSARCPPASMPGRSWTARWPREHAALRAHRPDRAHHARPARARQRHHARHAARARGRGGTGEPRPRGARDRARRRGQGLLRRLRPRAERRGQGLRLGRRTRRRSTLPRSRATTTRGRRGTRWWTSR